MLAELWSDWRSSWVVHEDSQLLVVDKPAGLPTQPDDERGDLLARLRAWKGGAYLGLLHPLDREMSGIVLVSKDAQVNSAFAKQLSQGVARRHLARVTRTPKRVEGFSCEVVSEGLIRLSSRRASQPVRRALAAAGSPVVGDVDNGGAPAARLMLHHESMQLLHPTSGSLALVAPWSGRDMSFEECLATAIDKRWAIARRGDTDAFRLVNAEGDGIDGSLEIDLYARHAVVYVRDEHDDFDALARLDLAGIYLKRRPKKASDADTRALAPPHAVRGDDAPDPLVVREGGLHYAVRLGDGLATGIFLDQRRNRALVRELTRDKRVLNLFGYTGAFTVAAAAGGAAESVTVDSSKTALERARHNLELNDASAERHALVHGDALVWLERARKRRERFDVIILDPPSFSTTRRSMFRAERDYRGLAASALACLAPGGSLLACTNHRGIVARDFKRLLAASAREAAIEVREMRLLPDPVDFPPPPGKPCHLKSVLVTT